MQYIFNNKIIIFYKKKKKNIYIDQTKLNIVFNL